MKYFEVKKEELKGMTVTQTVCSDGEPTGSGEDEGEAHSLVTGFSVFEYGENGMIDKVEFYPVKTNTEDWSDNSDDVFEKIKQNYTPDKWQNNDW